MAVPKKTVPIILALLFLRGGNGSNFGTRQVEDDRMGSGDDVGNAKDSSWYRLPDYVLPEKYQLWIYPQLAINIFTYEGRVEIDLRVLVETNSLIVHADGLEIHPEKSRVVEIVNETHVDIPIVGQELHIERQMYVVSLAKNIPPGRYALSLFFLGKIRDDLTGFYASSYEAAGKERWLGITQFSTIFARRAFPCFDEPYMKAKYRIHIGHYANETVTGNTAIQQVQRIKPDYSLTTLAETPAMSTYLVGWAIHDFTYTKASNDSAFGLWTRESMKNHDLRVLNECAKIYDALDKWIQVENPIAKRDHVAVPDFFWSAMENWGMVTFRESVVLWKDGVTPTSKMYRGLGTIAHEYAHTWFGNLVTPKFWNVAWLKEGFATFFGHYAVDIVHKDWRAMDLFAVETLQFALLEDSIQHNRTMNGKGVGSPESIPGCMDFVTYQKGSSIVRMVYYLVGDSAFQRGLQSYVKALASKYATPADFYEHVQHFADQEDLLEKPIRISDVVESWANQPGYPVITVARNYTTAMTEITQEKFYSDRDRQSRVSDDSRWWVPVTFATVESGARDVPTGATIWMKPQDKRIVITAIRPNDTIICNINQNYYYRVNYDQENWARLTGHLKSSNFENISSVNRASLLDDAFNLAKAGYIDYSIPLEMSKYLTREIEYEPWSAAIKSFDFLNNKLSSLPDLKRAFQAHVNRLIQPIYDKLTMYGSPFDNMRTGLLRNVIMSSACSTNNVHCLKSANYLFKEWLANNDRKINPDSKNAVYCAGIASSSADDWHSVLQMFLQTELHTEQELLINGLGCTNNPVLIEEFLNYSLHDSPQIRKQYRLTIFDAVLAGSPENVEHVLSFVDDNSKLIISARGTSFLTAILRSTARRIFLNAQLQKLTTIVDHNADLLGPTVETARRAVEIAEDNISWIAEYAPKIAKWLM